MKNRQSFNKEWHLQNRMPGNPTLDQRISWHARHSENCSCRPVPPGLAEEVAKYIARQRDQLTGKRPG